MWTSTSKVIQSNEVQKEKIQLDLDFPKSIITSLDTDMEQDTILEIVEHLRTILEVQQDTILEIEQLRYNLRDRTNN
jgi:hypothetical protein